MNLRQALLDIAEIRSQIARTEQCRALRSASVGFSGLLAFIAAAIQARWIPSPLQQLEHYLGLWCVTAFLGFAVPASRLMLRYYRSESVLVRRVTRLAFEQIAPPLVAGALVTYTLYRLAPESLWLLPGFWSVLYSLSVFASHHLFPRASVLVGMYYFAAGFICLIFARGEAALSAWAMIVTFGVGQLLAAAVLYFEWERPNA
jgi:hypothetical protein